MTEQNTQAQMELPRYQSFKRVHALKIAKVEGTTITPMDTRYAAFTVDPEMYLRYTPTEGDYYVVYADGYESFSPCKAFEEGYTLLGRGCGPHCVLPAGHLGDHRPPNV